MASRRRPGGIGGRTVQAAAASGSSGIIAEAGSSSLLTEPETRLLKVGVVKAPRRLGPREASLQPVDPILIDPFTWLNAPTEEMWYSSVVVGETVAADEAVGRIGNLFGETLVVGEAGGPTLPQAR